MTTHPIDTERIRFLAAYLDSDAAPLAASELAERVGPLLDALAAAEHRATRAEAQSAIRGRAVAIHRGRAREAEARIKAVQDVIGEVEKSSAHMDIPWVAIEDIRRALDGDA